MAWEVGRLLAGKYRVERVVGRGGMGVVLAVTHVELGERFAVKVLEDIDRHGGERLLREARAAARLRGEHIVRLHDVGRLEDGRPYLLLELVRGRSLAEELDANGPLEDAATALVLMQACVALAEAHGKGLVHRDIKPSNLLVTSRPDGRQLIKLIDFGIAKLADHADDVRLTARAAPLGSPQYMAPEQIRDAHGVDARADVWGLGVLAQELRTGSPPFAAFTTGGLLASIIADEPRSVPADVSPILRAVIAGCLVKNRDQRLADVTQVAAGLAPLLEDGDRWAERVARTFAAAAHDTSQEERSVAPASATRAEPPRQDRGPTTTTPPVDTSTTNERAAGSEPLAETSEEMGPAGPASPASPGGPRIAATALGLLLALGFGWRLGPTAAPAGVSRISSVAASGQRTLVSPPAVAPQTGGPEVPATAADDGSAQAHAPSVDPQDESAPPRPPPASRRRSVAEATIPVAVSAARATPAVDERSSGDDFERFGGRK
jgi:serine/threonine protein kinase